MFSLNYNVTLSLLFSLSTGLAGGILYFSVLPAFIMLITDSNTLVGLAEAISGIAEVLAAIPLGLFLDRPNVLRQNALRLGAMIGLITLPVMLYAIHAENYVWVCVSLGLLGVWNAFSLAPMETIFADSVGTGNRSSISNIKFVISVCSFACGPAIAMLLFHLYGDRWEAGICRTVMYFGLAFCVPAVVLQSLFLDRKTLGMESEGLLHTPIDTKSHTEATPRRQVCGMSERWVPYILSTAEILFSLAAGMTVKFFPLFFQKELLLSPVWVNFIYVLAPFCIGLLSTVAQRLSKCSGRPAMVCLTGLLGALLLLLMGVARSLWAHPLLIVTLYLLRTALANCGGPLQTSILMDYVPKQNRGKWNAVSSVSSFGWCGSAAVGGVLADRYGYGVTFVFTAGVYVLAAMFWIPLMVLVPRREIPISVSTSDLTAI
eukprot:NODE_1693_length_1411_cov_45.570872_g1607_i0.p1 GENE.NODE_1693_length_1411_cov_45.570872_g1607_i0~~NODE_1693_length_1411_cov_45.570872_g1607_i0.p1  ORF type:complete len:432 (+),score=89.52 NODE_1693_length_1411_cov_45.570872_g1607_i0:1-1296(+)